MTDIKEFFEKLDSERIEYLKDEAMSRHTSFRIGGPCRAFVIPSTCGELETAVSAAIERGIKYYILGNGTNVLFDDDPYDGVVISTSSLDSVTENGHFITAGAGCSLTSLSTNTR